MIFDVVFFQDQDTPLKKLEFDYQRQIVESN